MNLNPRERNIAFALGGLVLAYLLYSFVISPYLAARQDAQVKIDTARAQQKHDAELLANQPRVAADWAKLLASDLKTQDAKASDEINNVLFDWARMARLNVQSLKPDRPAGKGDFQQIRFNLSCEGASANASSFLLDLETTKLPLQIEKLSVTARKEGINDLSVQLTVSTLVFIPNSTTKPAARPTPTGDSL